MSPGQQIGADAEAHRAAGVTRRVHHLDVEVMPAEHLAVAKLLLTDHVRQVVRDTRKVANRLELLAIIGMDARPRIRMLL